MKNLICIAMLFAVGGCCCWGNKDPKRDEKTSARELQDQMRAIRPLVEDQANLQQQAKYRDRFDSQLTAQLNQAEEKKIPYEPVYRYPDNWPEISRARDEANARR